METKARSWAKSIVWRIIGVLIMPIIILGVSKGIGDDITTIALWSTIIFNGVRVVLYYFHERFWNSIKWGHTS